jgi:hypothetical protein
LTKYLHDRNLNLEKIKEHSNFDIITISAIEKNYNRMRDLIFLYVDKKMSFLDGICNNSKVDLNIIEEKNLQLLEIDSKIDALFKEIKHNPTSIVLYMKY